MSTSIFVDLEARQANDDSEESDGDSQYESDTGMKPNLIKSKRTQIYYHNLDFINDVEMQTRVMKSTKEEDDDPGVLAELAAAFQKRSHEENQINAAHERSRDALYNDLEEQNIFLCIPTHDDTLWRVIVKVAILYCFIYNLQ